MTKDITKDIKIYWSNSQLWYIAENADGTVIANYNRNFKPYSRVPYRNVANAVKSAGGLDAFRARLISLDEAEARLSAEAPKRPRETRKRPWTRQRRKRMPPQRGCGWLRPKRPVLLRRHRRISATYC